MGTIGGKYPKDSLARMRPGDKSQYRTAGALNKFMYFSFLVFEEYHCSTSTIKTNTKMTRDLDCIYSACFM